MAINTVWSVDLGRSSLKAAKLRRDRNHVEIQAIDKVDYPMSKNGVDAAAQAKEALSVFCARNNVKEPVVVAHPGQGTFSRFIKVPAFDEKKVKDMVGYEASQQIPFPLDEVVWDYHIIDRDYMPGEEREVALFAVRREAMDDFLLDFNDLELGVEVVSIGYLGLLNFVIHDIAPEEPAIILDIGATHTDLVLVDGNRFWIRPLPHSGNDITKAIMERFKLGFNEAEKLKIDTGKAPQKAVKIFQAVIQPKLKELLGEIHRSIGFYRSQAGETQFNHLYLLGNGSKIVGIKKFLEEQLGLQVHKVQSINHFRVSREANLRLLQSDLPSFATTLGCGLQALGVGPCKVDLVPSEEKLKKEVGRKRKHAYIAWGILFVLMFVTYGIIQAKRSTVEDALRQPQATLDEIKDQEAALEELKFPPHEEVLQLLGDLRQIGEARSSVRETLRALETVLAKVPNAEAPDKLVEEKNAEQLATDEGRAYRDTLLNDKIWIPALKATATTYPEEVKKVARGQKKPPTVAAFRFEAFVVCRLRASNAESAQFLEKNFSKPLEVELTKRGVTVLPDVALQAGSEITEIYHDFESKGAALTEEGYEERPFYGAVATWMIVPRHPEGEKQAEEPEKDGES